jgi:AcrR family transcriptional regulator
MPKVLTTADVSGFRERLCAAAETLFAAHGPESVTMRQLASVLGVSPMTPYRYFKDKDEILAAVRAAAFGRFADALEAARDGGGLPLLVSQRVADAYVAFALEQPQAYRLMFDLSQPTEDQYPALAAEAARARRTMTAHVRDLIEAGVLEGDADMIGHVFWASLHGTIVLQLAGKLSPGIDPAALREAVFVALARGFGVQQRSAST